MMLKILCIKPDLVIGHVLVRNGSKGRIAAALVTWQVNVCASVSLGKLLVVLYIFQYSLVNYKYIIYALLNNLIYVCIILKLTCYLVFDTDIYLMSCLFARLS